MAHTLTFSGVGVFEPMPDELCSSDYVSFTSLGVGVFDPMPDDQRSSEPFHYDSQALARGSFQPEMSMSPDDVWKLHQTQLQSSHPIAPTATCGYEGTPSGPTALVVPTPDNMYHPNPFRLWVYA